MSGIVIHNDIKIKIIYRIAVWPIKICDSGKKVGRSNVEGSTTPIDFVIGIWLPGLTPNRWFGSSPPSGGASI